MDTQVNIAELDEKIKGHVGKKRIKKAIVTVLTEHPEKQAWASSEMLQYLQQFEPSITAHSIRAYMLSLKNSPLGKHLSTKTTRKKNQKKITQYGFKPSSKKNINTEEAISLAETSKSPAKAKTPKSAKNQIKVREGTGKPVKEQKEPRLVKIEEKSVRLKPQDITSAFLQREVIESIFRNNTISFQMTSPFEFKIILNPDKK